jgi:hypothetical protein
MGLTQKLGTIPLAILTDASNNVGIGAAPSGSYKLEVTGTAKISGASILGSDVTIGLPTTNATLSISGDNSGGDSFLNFKADIGAIKGQIQGTKNGANGGIMYFKTLQSSTLTTAMTIKEANVGIGTTSPTVITGFTSVCANNATTGAFFEAQQGGTVLTRFGGQSDITFIDTVANLPFIIKTNATERMRFNSGGGVNIGSGGVNAFYNGLTSFNLDLGSVGLFSYSGQLYQFNNTYHNGSTGFYYKYSGSGVGGMVVENAGNITFVTAPSGTANNLVTLSTRMTILQAGNVGIGVTSTVGKLDINTGGNTNVVISNDSSDTGYNIVSLNGTRTKGSYAGIAGGGTADNNLYLNSPVGVITQTGASFSERMRVTSTGLVGIGTNSPAALLHIQGAAVSYGFVRILSTSDSSGESSMNIGRTNQTIEQRWTYGQGTNGIGDSLGWYTGGGNKATLTTAGVWSTTGGGTSDLRTKQDVDYNFDNGIESILKLQPTKFKFKEAPNKQRRGFIAQDVLEVIPDLVLGDGEKEDGTYGLDYDGILAIAVKAIQELNERLNKAGL